MKEITVPLDSLAIKALGAIEAMKPHMASWIADKRQLLCGASRLQVLNFIVFDLDGGNRRIVFESLGLDPRDAEALERILRKI